MGSGTLFVVATPIGNLGDITRRAVEVLQKVPAIACEDTRHTRKLLSHLGIGAKVIFSVHKFNEKARMQKVLDLLEAGSDVALVSDAGTPGLSDPGHLLVAQAAARGLRVEPVPGPSALVAALSASGLAADRFVFEGFLPRKAASRRRRLEELRQQECTLVFFEAPHRIKDCLRDSLEILGDRQAVLARELTKLHEEFLRGRLRVLMEKIGSWERSRGEMVLIVEGAGSSTAREPQQSTAGDISQEFKTLQAENKLSRNEALRNLARRYGLSRREVYRKTIGDA